jgi:hypothetical protein
MSKSRSFIIVTAVYAIIRLGLYFYWHGRVGPRFWAIIGSIGVTFDLLGNFSPFTDQSPQHILNSYTSVAAGLACASA